MQNFFKDKKGKVVLWQRPNALIIVWVTCTIAGRLVPSGSVQPAIRYVGSVALIAWALLEIFAGTTYFRRTLGAIVLAFSIYSRLR